MELNKEQIIKALECCIDQHTECSNCPLRYTTWGSDACFKQAKINALALIKELLDRIEILEILNSVNDKVGEEYANLHDAYTELTRKVEELTEENERLREDNEIKSQRRANMYEILDAHKRGRADAVREMVRIIVTKYAISKVHYADNEEPIITCVLTNWQLDQIADEMLEGK